MLSDRSLLRRAIDVVYILINFNFYPFNSGDIGLPAYTGNWTAHIRFLIAIHLTSDHVLF
jgi:hypothetical protein